MQDVESFDDSVLAAILEAITAQNSSVVMVGTRLFVRECERFSSERSASIPNRDVPLLPLPMNNYRASS
jgi:hypothetical protein